MRSLFEKNLMRMKQELTDLKTAHRRGLGTIRYYRYRITISTSTYGFYYIKGYIADGEPTWPLVMALARGNDPTVRAASAESTQSGTSFIEAEIYAGEQSTVTVDIISSSALSRLELES